MLMRDPSYWNDKEKLIEYLARQLVAGRLGLLLGAGVSRDFGLPSWDELIGELSHRTGTGDFAPGDNAARRAQVIKETKFKHDESAFLDLVQKVLYENASIDLEHLTDHRLLSAIASLVMASRRGSASKVITLNFDDVLETYLEYFGFVSASIAGERHWASNSDVVVYHPHGFLPHAPERKRSSKIVLGSRDFFKAIATSADNPWRLLLITLMRTHTFLHIGLSGEDMNVESLMEAVQPLHAASPEGGGYAGEAAFVGVRFGLSKNAASQRDTIELNRGYGVFTHLIDGEWEQLPSFLFQICQTARSIRAAQDAN